MSSTSRFPLWALGLAALGGCGGDRDLLEVEIARPQTESRQRNIPISGYGGERPSAGVQKSLDRVDPRKSKWHTEHLHELAKPELAEFVALIASHRPVKSYDTYLSQTFEGTSAWVPVRFEEEFDDRTLRHRVGIEFSPESYDVTEIPEVVSALLEAFGWSPPRRAAEDVDLHTKTKVFTTDLIPGSPRLFTTTANVVVDGPTPGGQSVQINMEWLLRWEVLGTPADQDEHVRIKSIRMLSYRDTLNRGPMLFANVTDHVFQGIPRFGAEFLIGAGEYHHKLDLMDGNVFSGQIGVALGDVDEDGLIDLFVPQQGGHANRLLRHLSDDTLEDISEGSGLELLEGAQSALILDFDNDGHVDVAMACDNLLLIGYGDGKGKFRLMRPFASGTDKIKSMVAADWDNDGDLDIYACIYSKQGPLGTTPNPYHDATNGPRNVAWRNDLDATLEKHRWKDVTDELGLDHHNNKFSYAAVFEDFDSDNDLDLYVVNDFGRNNFYRNDDGHFSDVAIEVGADDVAAGMGVSAGDVDGDGDVDIYVTNMWSSAGRRIVSQTNTFMQSKDRDLRAQYLRHARGNTLLLNKGDGTFEDGTEESGAMNGGWAWGALLVDLNNDGLQDAYSPNGFITGVHRDDI